MNRNLLLRAAAAVLMGGAAAGAWAHDAGSLSKNKAEAGHKRAPAYSPYVGRDFPTRPFFGDTHLQTDVLAEGQRFLVRDNCSRSFSTSSSSGRSQAIS